MAEKNDVLQGPFEITMLVHVTDGERDGKISINLTMATTPTKSDVTKCLDRATEEAKAHGLRLMTRQEFLNVMMEERLGSTETVRFPGGDEWDA